MELPYNKPGFFRQPGSAIALVQNARQHSEVQLQIASRSNILRGSVLKEERSHFQSYNPLHARIHTNSRRATKMFPIKRILGSAFLAVSLFIAVAGSGCAARLRIYDESHSDYHKWDRNEDVVYRSYWNGRNQPYRDYDKLNKDEQKEYWNWRHDHADKH
jgi:hypothetical protein